MPSLTNKKANIKKRLSIPAINEINYKDKLLEVLKEDEDLDSELKKKSSKEINEIKDKEKEKEK